MRVNIQTVVRWMADRGIVAYQVQIDRCLAIAARAAVQGKARFVTKMENRIHELRQSAFDRYQDWATD